MRVSAGDVAAVLLEKAKHYHTKGMWSLWKPRRKFFLELAQKHRLAADAVERGTIELIPGPVGDFCLNPQCVAYAESGHDVCPHESRGAQPCACSVRDEHLAAEHSS